MSKTITWVFTFASVPGLSHGQVVSYEATSLFPEETTSGWIHWDTIVPAKRWIFDGVLCQSPILLPCPPYCTTQDYYIRNLVDQSGISGWFLTWKVESNGPQAWTSVAPASIVAGGTTAAFYHFIMARDRVRFIRGNPYPPVYADVEPDLPHVFRLELTEPGGVPAFSFFVDGELIDHGTGDHRYPTPDSSVTFGVQAAIQDNTTRWTYVRFGRLWTPSSGDFDSDGHIDGRDAYFFAECVAEGGPGSNAFPACPWADFDFDNDVDFADFAYFQRAFTGSD